MNINLGKLRTQFIFMTTVSARIPESLEAELEEFIDEQKLDKSTAVRKLISEGLEEWRKQKALQKLESEEISFSKAAKLAEMDIWKFSDLIKEEKITWVKDEKVKSDLKSL